MRLPLPLPALIGIAAGLLVAIASLVFVLRRRRATPPAPTLALPAPVGELERVLEAKATERTAAAIEAGGEPSNLLPGNTVRDRVLDAVRADVERTAGVLTAWLAEPAKAAEPARKGAK